MAAVERARQVKAIVRLADAARLVPVDCDRPSGRGAVTTFLKSDRAEAAARDVLAGRKDGCGVSSGRSEAIVSKHSAAFAGARGVG